MEMTFRRLETILFPAVVALMVACIYRVFIVVPNEVTMGPVQRIFYFHVPSAWVSFLSFFVVFLGSILYLWTRQPAWDTLAHAAAELGAVFCAIVLITGPIWARPIWGTWWTWEARLTTTLVLELVYVAYLVLRSQAENRAQEARFAAVLGIVGFLDVPIIYFSVELWRGHHPIVFKTGGGEGLAPVMLVTFILCMLTFTLLFILLLIQRFRLGRLRDELAELREREQSPEAWIEETQLPLLGLHPHLDHPGRLPAEPVGPPPVPLFPGAPSQGPARPGREARGVSRGSRPGGCLQSGTGSIGNHSVPCGSGSARETALVRLVSNLFPLRIVLGDSTRPARPGAEEDAS